MQTVLHRARLSFVLAAGGSLLAAPAAGAQADLVVEEVQLADGVGGFQQGGLPNYANTEFGRAAASLGDHDGDGVTDLIVGQPEAGLAQPGRIYTLFLNSNGTVRSQVEISTGLGGFGGTLESTDEFGAAVCALGDVDGDGITDIAVGAPRDDDGATNSGAVYVLFLDASGAVKGDQKLSNDEGGLGFTLDFSDDFGSSVEGLGDLDGDGIPDLVVGAPRDDDGGIDRGAVYVLFLASDGTVASHQKISQTSGLFPAALDDGGQFGTSLALLGDVNGSGFPELAIGQEEGLANGVKTGSLWIATLFANGLVLGAANIEDGAGGFEGVNETGDLFGCSVEVLGDLNGDGVVDLGVGASNADAPDSGFQQGILWILYLTDSLTVLDEDRIGRGEGGLDAQLGNGDAFGASLAGLGDLDGDGLVELVVGSPEDDLTASSAGSVRILTLEFCGATASATERNAGSNPSSYSADAPVLGETWTATVDLSTTGHTLAGIVGYPNAFQLPLPGGQTLLVIDALGTGELLQLPVVGGPLASFELELPLDSGLCGLDLYTQAVHVGGVAPFALSNAQDLVLGTEP